MSSLLNYSIPPYQILIGNFDITRHLGTLRISTGIADINSPCLWQGSFEVFFTVEAERQGLTHADFSEIKSPQRWRKGLQPVSLWIQGYPVAKLRIEDYRYDESQRSGQGQLIQLPALLDFEQPSLEVEGVEVGEKTPLSSAIASLVRESGRDRQSKQIFFNPTVQPPAVTGEIDTRLITQRPIQDAQRLAGIFFQWMRCNFSEVIEFVPYPRSTPALFSRGLKQIEITPDYNNINFAAETVIVTGSRQVTKRREKGKEEKDKEEEARKPSEIITETYGILGAVVTDSRFFDPNGGLKYIFHFPGDEVLVEKKRIKYKYSKVVDAEGDIRKGEVITTITEREVLLPTVISSDFYDPNDNVTTGFSIVREYGIIERITESENRKIVEQMAATFMDLEMFDLNNSIPSPPFSPKALVVRQDEKTDYVPFKSSSKAPDPNRPEPEEDLPDPELEMETQVFKGVAKLAPVGWSAFMPKTRIENIGFLPSQAIADKLALDIALIELQRRDAQQITLPPPLEWLQAGCPFFFGVNVHDSAYIADALILAIAEGECSFSFTGNRTGSIPTIPNPPDPIPFIAKLGLNVVPPPSLNLRQGQQIEIPIQAFNTIAGTAFSYEMITPLPPGLSLNATGSIVGTATEPFAPGYFVGRVVDLHTGEEQRFQVWLAGLKATSPTPDWAERREFEFRIIYSSTSDQLVTQILNQTDSSLFTLTVLQYVGTQVDRSGVVEVKSTNLNQLDRSSLSNFGSHELTQIDSSYCVKNFNLRSLGQKDTSYLPRNLPVLRQIDSSDIGQTTPVGLTLIDSSFFLSTTINIYGAVDSSVLVPSASIKILGQVDISNIPYSITESGNTIDTSVLVSSGLISVMLQKDDSGIPYFSSPIVRDTIDTSGLIDSNLISILKQLDDSGLPN